MSDTDIFKRPAAPVRHRRISSGTPSTSMTPTTPVLSDFVHGPVQVTQIVHQDLVKLVPYNILNEISCFVIYDKHPRDTKSIDITICTKYGEVKEFYQLELVSEFFLSDLDKNVPTYITIMRNSECLLFYLVLAKDKIRILSRKDKLELHRTVNDVDKFVIDDPLCNGRACLRIFKKGMAVPLIYDDNFETFSDNPLLATLNVNENPYTMSVLKDKLINFRGTVQCNKKMYKDYKTLRQLIAFSIYREIRPNLTESVFKCDLKNLSDSLHIKTSKVKLCNKKMIIVLDISNCGTESLEDVQILLHVHSRPSLVYKTRLFESLPSFPFWKEQFNHSIGQKKVAVTAVIDLKQLKDVPYKVNFGVMLMYKKNDRYYYLPFESIVISPKDMRAENFDELSSFYIVEEATILAVLATTEKTNLILRHIKGGDEPIIHIPRAVNAALYMEYITSNVIVKTSSPYHPLNGVMCIFSDATSSVNKISLHTRSPSQALSFINYVHNAENHKLIITAANHKLISKTSEFSHYDQELYPARNDEYSDYAIAVMKQATMLIDYIDLCVAKMTERQDPETQNQYTKIDLYAAGRSAYEDLKTNMTRVKHLGLMRWLYQ